MNCPYCQAPYAYSARVKAEIPTCSCLRDKAEEEFQADRAQRAEASALQRVEALRLGPVGAFDRWPIAVDGWADPKVPILGGKNLVVMGPVGTAKTTLLKQVAYRAAMSGLKVRGGYGLEVMKKLKDFDGGGVREYSSWLAGGHVLILDDFDKLLATEYEVREIMLFIDRYWAFGRSLVVSMNKTPDQLEMRLSSRRGEDLGDEAKAIFSRLMGTAKVVVLSGADLRQVAP